MNICGIVAEYNPFHNGHAYQIAQTRARLGADCAVVAVMSGNFVQRGEYAVMGKYARAACAVDCGADLVLELPTTAALSSAEGFAAGAVALLSRLTVVSHLSFGSECGDLAALNAVVDALESFHFPVYLADFLSQGMSFAAARQRAVEALAPAHAALLSEPNNILAVEYLKALRREASPIVPLTITRCGAMHDGAPEGRFSSASHLRTLLYEERVTACAAYMPAPAYMRLCGEVRAGRAPVPTFPDEGALLTHLRRFTPEMLAELPDSGAGEGLPYRFYDAVRSACTAEELFTGMKTRRYVHARLKRLVLCAWLGIDRRERPDFSYCKVLALSARGREVLRHIKRLSRIQIITKPVDAALADEAARQFSLEARLTDLYVMSRPVPSARRCGEELRATPYVRSGAQTDASTQARAPDEAESAAD